MPTVCQQLGQFRHFYAVSNPGRPEVDETQEFYYPPIMKTIASADYDGYVGQEFSPRDGANWAVSLEAAYRVCDV